MLKWTKKKPVKEGWYWKKDRFGVDIVYVRWYVKRLCIINWEIPDNAEWAGPLKKPRNIGRTIKRRINKENA